MTYTVRVTPPNDHAWTKAGFTTIEDALRWRNAYVSSTCIAVVLDEAGVFVRTA